MIGSFKFGSISILEREVPEGEGRGRRRSKRRRFEAENWKKRAKKTASAENIMGGKGQTEENVVWRIETMSFQV